MSTIESIINRRTKTTETPVAPPSRKDVEQDIKDELVRVREAVNTLVDAYNRLRRMPSRERELEGYISYDPVRLVATIVKREGKALNVQEKMFAHPRQGEY